MEKNLILASNSPRRREILLQGGYDFFVDAADIDENIEISDPVGLVEELSARKARAVADRHPGNVIIGADTLVYTGDTILGKPQDTEDAAAMLRKLSGATHRVVTGVTILSDGRAHTFSEITEVTFYELSDAEIEDYVATGEPMDKAGAYGIQGRGALLIKAISGDYLNVVGLPLARLHRELEASSVAIPN